MGNTLDNRKISRQGSVLIKVQSLRSRAELLGKLRPSVGLPPEYDITTEQWQSLEIQLSTASNEIRNKLRSYTDKYYSERNNPKYRQILANLLGELEMEVTEAYNFYDTFMDILTQRHSKHLGKLLRGCDALAAHAMKRGHLAELTVAPLVYCDRGFGASILREGVNVTKGIPNPIPFIGIPYSRVNEKYNLISIFHEVGHQALVKLNMVELWKEVIKQSLLKDGAPSLVASLYANWSRELVPDFWSFCLCGMAQTCSIRDVLVLPARMMFNISPVQPHPPSYLRFLASVEWCRQLWGRGEWDAWEQEWIQLYPLEILDETTSHIMASCRKYLPNLAKAIMTTRFRKLGNRPLSALFDMRPLAPPKLRTMANFETISQPTFRTLLIGTQLAVFRMMRENPAVKPVELDKRMEEWLVGLGYQQK